jgi:peptidoglycan-associated lipoprotein
MRTRCWNGTLAVLLVLAVLVGCAKRPATTQVSAPAPTGAAGATGAAAQPGMPTQPGAAMQPGAPGPTAGMAPTPAVAAPGTAPGAAPGTTAPGAAAPGTAAARPAPREFTSVPELRDIHFDFDKYDIRPGDAKILDANAAWLKQNDNMLVLIEGHADERGTNEYNLALGERRAKAAMNYLVAQGVQANRITIISYGEERPVCTEKNEACWARNRRAHFLVKPR